MTSLDDAEIKRILKEEWDIDADELHVLEGYFDINRRVVTRDKSFVFKATVYDSEDIIDLQNKAMLHLRKKGMSVPEPIPNKDGKLIVKHAGLLLRVLTWIPGEQMGKKDWPPEVLRQAGALVAKIDNALADFDHPSADHEITADISQALINIPYVEELDDPDVTQIFHEFEKQVLPALQDLPKHVIHNDGHQHNLVVNNGTVAGLIDFGDMVKTQVINGLAVCLATFLLIKQDFATAAHLYTGYISERSINAAEQQLLPSLIKTRIAFLLAEASHETKEHPDNEYIKQYIGASKKTLQWLRQFTDKEILEQLTPSAARG